MSANHEEAGEHNIQYDACDLAYFGKAFQGDLGSHRVTSLRGAPGYQ